MKFRRIIARFFLVSLAVVLVILVWLGKITIPTGLVSVLLGIFMTNVFSYIFDLMGGEDKTGKLKHSEYLVKDVFEHLVSNGYVYYENDKIAYVPINWIKSADVEQHLKHRKYKELCHAYEYAKDYSNTRSLYIEKEIQRYRETVGQKLKEAQI